MERGGAEGDVQAVRAGDDDEAANIVADGRRSIVERFRSRYAGAELRDAGETTFAGRRAHAYEVVRWTRTPPSGRTTYHPPATRETYYLDPDSGLPLGAVTVLRLIAPPAAADGREVAPDTAQTRITETVLRFERLPDTPANLAKLDAPAIRSATTGGQAPSEPADQKTTVRSP